MPVRYRSPHRAIDCCEISAQTHKRQRDQRAPRARAHRHTHTTNANGAVVCASEVRNARAYARVFSLRAVVLLTPYRVWRGELTVSCVYVCFDCYRLWIDFLSPSAHGALPVCLPRSSRTLQPNRNNANGSRPLEDWIGLVWWGLSWRGEGIGRYLTRAIFACTRRRLISSLR